MAVAIQNERERLISSQGQAGGGRVRLPGVHRQKQAVDPVLVEPLIPRPPAPRLGGRMKGLEGRLQGTQMIHIRSER